MHVIPSIGGAPRRLWLAWGLGGMFARLPGNMAPLGLVLAAGEGRGAIAAGGFTVGVAAGAVWRGRAIDRAGYRHGLGREAVLLASASAALAAAIAADAPLAGMLVAAAALGVTASAVGPAYRAAVAAFVPRRARTPAYSVDSALTEVSFVVSPVLAAALVAFAPPSALFAVAAALAAGSAALTRALPAEAAGDRPEPAPVGTWLRATVPVYAVTAGVGVAYGLLVAGLPERMAELGWARSSSGVLFGLMSAASVLASLAIAVRGRAPTHRRAVAALLAVFAAAVTIVALAPHPVVAAAAMALFGVPLSPLGIAGTAVLTRRVPESAHAQAIALWAAVVTSTMGVGLVAAAGVLGIAGPIETLAVGAGIYALVACCVALARLSGRATGTPGAMSEHREHEAKANEVERELDEMQEAGERLQGEIDATGEEWERKKRDSSVPGAAGMPSEAQGPEPEAEYPTKGSEDEAAGDEPADFEGDENDSDASAGDDAADRDDDEEPADREG
jgi:hypothetical protein